MEETVLEEEYHSHGHGHIQAHVRGSVVVEVWEHYHGQLFFGMRVDSHWPAMDYVEFRIH